MNIDEFAKGSARPPLDFDRINMAALANLLAILHRWLPDGGGCDDDEEKYSH